MSIDRFLAVFDLDYTVWQPEMYQLYGRPRFVPAPKQFSDHILKECKTVKDGMILTDSGGSPMRVFPGAYVNSGLTVMYVDWYLTIPRL